MYRKDKCRRCDVPCSSAPTKCVKCDLACYCSTKCQADDRWRHEVDCKMARLVRRCSDCGSNGTSMKQCCNCLQVWYCGQACQKKNWSVHKPECQRVSESIIKVASMINTRHTFPIRLGTLYYWGNIPAVDLINLSLNEGCEYSKPLALLLCGVGDPRNVALSVASLPDGYQEKLTFVLNDNSVCTLARTVLLLFMLLEGGQEAAQSVTQVWYSIRISDQHHTLLTSALQRLIQATSLEGLTHGVMSATADHFKALKRVWQTWFDLSSRKGAWVTEGRRRMLARDDGAAYGIQSFLAEIPQQHKLSAREWFEDGILLPKKSRKGAKRENVTLTGSIGLNTSGPDVAFNYCIPSDCLPFVSWDYRDANGFCAIPSLLEMYSKYVDHVLAACATRLVSGQVKVQYILSDCLDMQPFLPDDLAFDRVMTTNLSDYIPLTTLLELGRPLLNRDNPSAVIVTEFLNWCQRYYPEIRRTIMLEANFGVHAETVLQDTGNAGIANSTGRVGITEYYDLSPEFLMFIRACLLSPDVADASRGKRRVPSSKAMALKHGLVLRNFLRNENRVFPFRWPINCRRVTQLNGFERAVEWVLPVSKPVEIPKVLRHTFQSLSI